MVPAHPASIVIGCHSLVLSGGVRLRVSAVIPNLVNSGIEIGQLLIEVHWPLHLTQFRKHPVHKQTSALHAQFFGQLEEMGFAVAHVEFNIACGFTCVEFLWVNRKLYPHGRPQPGRATGR